MSLLSRFSLPSFVAGAAAATVVALPVAVAAFDAAPTGHDGTVPALTVQPAGFVVGGRLDPATPPDPDNWCSGDPWNTAVPLRLRWTATDPGSGVAGYDVWGTGPVFDGHVKLVEGTRATSYDLLGESYQGDCGGGQDVDRSYWVVAKDTQNNSSSSSTVSDNVTVWQETGLDQYGDPGLPLARTGTWTAARCACFNHGRTLFSTKAGASLTYTVAIATQGHTLALVAATGADRGAFRVAVDGGTETSVDTYSASPGNRVVVWQRFLAPGTHRVAVTNAGTTGRPRVDVDSLLLGPAFGGRTPEPTDSGS
jgi:hypothetical protein